MGNVRIVKARPQHVGTIARRMRAADVEECKAAGHSPKQALRHALTASTLAYTAFVDGRAEACFGLVVHSALGGKGLPWFLSTDETYRHPREMIRWGQRFLAMFSDSTPGQSGLVGKGNARAIRLLRHWGFLVREEVIVCHGVEMVPFEMERS